MEVELLRIKGHGYQKYMRKFLKFLRYAKYSEFKIFKQIYRFLFHFHSLKHNNEIITSKKIGYGFSLWHPFNVNIASTSIIGNNVTINKGVLIGREFRGARRGTPTIGDFVWIGSNAAVVWNIKVGNDVLIAPNSFVNCNIPDHSVVFGNPCIIKLCENATKNYIQHLLLKNDFK